jgi:hypothetical protein
MMLKDAVSAHVKVLSKLLPVGTAKNHESTRLVSGPISIWRSVDMTARAQRHDEGIKVKLPLSLDKHHILNTYPVLN